MKKIIFLLMILVLAAGCASSSKFARIYGTKNVNLHDIKVYRSEPPETIRYKSLGTITATGSGAFTLVQFDNALANLTLKAKDMGANGVIKWRTRSGVFSVTMDGEAVIFEEFPETEIKKAERSETP